MLESKLAQEMIKKMSRFVDYRISIMNDHGIVIASNDPSKIGNVSEPAYHLLEDESDRSAMHAYDGPRPCVNLFIRYKTRNVGVLSVSGDAKTVENFASLLRVSLETVLEYEGQLQKERSEKSLYERFLNYLLFEENFDISEAEQAAEKYGIKADLVRAVVLIRFDSAYLSSKIEDILSRTEGYQSQDMTMVTRNEDIVLMKSFGTDPEKAVREYRTVMQNLRDNFDQGLIKVGYDPALVQFYVGSLQVSFDLYRKSYFHAIKFCLITKEQSSVHYFNDYILDFYRSLVTINTYHDIFNVYDSVFDEKDKKMISETAKALKTNNYNIVSSAKTLYIHRNTLLFRLNKLKDMLSIDPISRAADRHFLNELAYYFRYE